MNYMIGIPAPFFFFSSLERFPPGVLSSRSYWAGCFLDLLLSHLPGTPLFCQSWDGHCFLSFRLPVSLLIFLLFYLNTSFSIVIWWKGLSDSEWHTDDNFHCTWFLSLILPHVHPRCHPFTGTLEIPFPSLLIWISYFLNAMPSSLWIHSFFEGKTSLAKEKRHIVGKGEVKFILNLACLRIFLLYLHIWLIAWLGMKI